MNINESWHGDAPTYPSSDNGDTGNPPSRPSPAQTTTTQGGDPVPPEDPNSLALSGAQPLKNPWGHPCPEPPKSNDQFEALAKELTKM